MKLIHYLASLTKINSKGIQDVNIRHETMRLLEENIRKELFDTGLGNNFFEMIQI